MDRTANKAVGLLVAQVQAEQAAVVQAQMEAMTPVVMVDPRGHRQQQPF